MSLEKRIEDSSEGFFGPVKEFFSSLLSSGNEPSANLQDAGEVQEEERVFRPRDKNGRLKSFNYPIDDIRFFSSRFSYSPNCYLGPTVPGAKVIKSLGVVSISAAPFFSSHPSKGMIRKMDTKLEALFKHAGKLGANAVVNTKIEFGDHSILVYGEAVIVEFSPKKSANPEPQDV